jgi:hypothetical protein
MQLLLDCLLSTDTKVCRAAILVVHDLVLTVGNALLPYIHDAQDDAQSMCVQLLIKAAGGGDTDKAAAAAADAALK